MATVTKQFAVDGREFEVRQYEDGTGVHLGVFEGGSPIGVTGTISNDTAWAAKSYLGSVPVDVLAQGMEDYVRSVLEP